MGRFLDSLERFHPAYQLVASDDGVTLIRQDGHTEEFNVIARRLIDTSGEDFVALPTTDGSTGYERVFLLPI